MSMKTRAHPFAAIVSGTAARCTIFYKSNYSQNITIIRVIGFGNLEYKVHGNGVSALFQDRQRLQWGTKCRTRFHPQTNLARTNVLAHKLVIAVPVKVAT